MEKRKTMVTNVLDYMYEGYGYDMDNQLLYTDVEKYDETLDDYKINTNGMETFSHQEVITHADAIPTENDNKYIEVEQFVSQNIAKYTDLRKPLCKCCN